MTRNRKDLSQFLIHLTKEGTFERYDADASVPPHFSITRVTVSASISLALILQDMRIQARGPFGYFKNKVDRTGYARNFRNGSVDPMALKSSCFSETPLMELNRFYAAAKASQNQYAKYGLGFSQENLRAKGANPVFYADSRKPNLLAALNSMVPAPGNASPFVPMFHLFETFGPTVYGNSRSDFRWEREWRLQGDLNFSYEDVEFGICPGYEIRDWESYCDHRVVFLDPDWDERVLRRYLKIRAPHLLARF